MVDKQKATRGGVSGITLRVTRKMRPSRDWQFGKHSVMSRFQAHERLHTSRELHLEVVREPVGLDLRARKWSGVGSSRHRHENSFALMDYITTIFCSRSAGSPGVQEGSKGRGVRGHDAIDDCLII